VDSVVVVLGTLSVVVCVGEVVIATAVVVLVASPTKDSETGPSDLLSRAAAVVVVRATGVSVNGLEANVVGTSFATVEGETAIVAVDKLATYVVVEMTGIVLSVLGTARVVSVVEFGAIWLLKSRANRRRLELVSKISSLWDRNTDRGASRCRIGPHVAVWRKAASSARS